MIVPGPPGLYIHIPFCQSKCPYCDFGSVPAPSSSLLSAYFAALLKQVEGLSASPALQEMRFGSLFIGGGTPTVYEGAELARLVRHCLERFHFVEKPEISMEANPNTVSTEKLQAVQQAGLNRLSIGVQSFCDDELNRIGRIHTAVQAVDAIHSARAAGIGNINIDLMYGLPAQTVTDWQRNVEAALACGPQHLALYELTIEEETPFAGLVHVGELTLPDEDTVLAMEERSRTLLAEQDFERYEISNYARHGYACAHNINYWQNGAYLGLGAGAVSFLAGKRMKNLTNPAEYAAAIKAGKEFFQDQECLSGEAGFRETVVMGLRLLHGISEQELADRFGLSLRNYYGEILEKMIAENLLVFSAGRLRLTDKGLPVANQVLAELV